MASLTQRDASVNDSQLITPKTSGEALRRPLAKRLRRLEQQSGLVCVHCGAPLICALCEQLPGEPARWEFSRLTDAEVEELERLIHEGVWRGPMAGRLKAFPWTSRKDARTINGMTQ